MKLIAQKEFSYPFINGRKLKIGDLFEAPDQLARTLLITRLAIEAKPIEGPEPRIKRKYKRRDMTVEGVQTMIVEED